MVWWAKNLKPNKMLADHFGMKLRSSSQTVVCVLRSVTVSSLNQEVSVLQNHHVCASPFDGTEKIYLHSYNRQAKA